MGIGEQGRGARDGGLATGVVLRAVTEADAPWPGLIVRDAHGRSTLHVDAALLGDWSAWRADSDGHLLAPLDIERTAGGHELVLPLCLRRIDDLLQARADAAASLSDGEAVTLAVSMLRGCAEAQALGADSGQWWVTDDGRPVLAVDLGAAVPAASQLLLRAMAEDRPQRLSDALRAAADVMSDPRTMQRDIGLHEDALFACAEPEPLVTTILAPARARVVAVAGSARDTPGHAVTALAPEERSLPTGGILGALRATIARHVDGAVADDVSAALSRSRGPSVHDRGPQPDVPAQRRGDGARRPRAARRPRSERPAPSHPRPSAPRTPRTPRDGRRRWAPALVAASLGFAVLGAGLLWPSGDDPASADPAASSPSPSATPSPEESRAGTDAASGSDGTSDSGAPEESAGDLSAGSPGEGDDAPAETSDEAGPGRGGADATLPDAALPVLAAAAGCASGVSPCGGAVWENPTRGAPDGALALDPAARTVALVEEFGGVAVLRLTPSTDAAPVPPDQIIVIVAANGKWLVRDAYDVADQP